MKNTLAENMLRFGVKNLKESDVKRIEESVLTEDNNLMNSTIDQQLRKTFSQQIAKQSNRLSAYVDRYYAYSIEPNPITYSGGSIDTRGAIIGKMIAIEIIAVPGLGNLPLLPDTESGFGGVFEYVPSTRTFQKLEYEAQTYITVNTVDDALRSLNSLYSSVNPEIVKQLYSISPNKAAIDTAINDFKLKHRNLVAKLPANMKTAFSIVA
jgi:hypothetical protein